MIHQYRSNGYNIVLDVNSGSVHVVDDATYDLIPEIEKELASGADAEAVRKKYAGSEMEEPVEEILELVKENLLFTEDIYENYIDQFMKRETVVKAMCLHVAHDCNLACRYCFAGEGEYHGDRELMSLEVGKKALDYLVEHSGNRINLEVDFFGGEPLLNWEVVKQLVAYGRSLEKTWNKKFRFTLTTNGTLLTDEIMDFVNQEMSNLVLSIDGQIGRAHV